MRESEKITSDIVFQMIDVAGEAIIIVDSQMTVHLWNKSAEKLFGTSAQDAIGKNVASFISPAGLRASSLSDSNTVDELFVPVNSTFLLERQTKSKESVWTERSTKRLIIGDTCWTLFVLRNVDDRKKREQKLQREASTDSLSQLANRRGFQESLEANLSKPLTLAIVDIDLFKNINDEWGHPIGDEVIQLVAERLRSSFPSAISIGRLGGDEFGVILETTEQTETVEIFENFIASFNKNNSDESGPQITVSVGAAISNSRDNLARSFLSAADQCLYKSKTEGRNRVTLETI